MTWCSRLALAPEGFRLPVSLLGIGNARPPRTRAKRSCMSILANRLRQNDPETEENGDQRDAKPQPSVHPSPPALGQHSMTRGRGAGGNPLLFDSPLHRKPIDQREPFEAFAESPREIIHAALPAQSAPLSNLLHRHPQNQNLMHQRRAVGAEFTLGAVQPQHCLALAFRDRLPRPHAVDIFPCWIDGLRSAFGLLPIILKCPQAVNPTREYVDG